MDGVYELVIGGFNGNGQFAQNVSHWQVAGTSAEDEYGTAHDLVQAYIATNLNSQLAFMGTDITLNVFYARKVDGSGGASIFVDNSSVGAGGGSAISNALAVDVAFYPGGAKNRPGHWFAWGATAAGIVGDVLQGAFVTLLNTWLNKLLTPLALPAGTATFSTYTRKTKTATPATHYNIKPKLTGLNKRTVPLY